MHPSSLLSYYPTYAILDEVVAKNNYKNLTIYIDLKNNLQTVYMEHAIVNIVEQSKKAKAVDTSVFSSLVSFLAFHKIYAHKRGINVNFIIFFETGHSIYHKNISKKYKISRRIDDLYGLDSKDRELFYKVLHANYQLIENAFNKMPGIKVIRLNKLEADFVPYYLISRKLVSYKDDTAHIIYSNDHDLWQCITDHVFVFSKTPKSKKIIEKGEVMSEFLHVPNNIPDVFLPLAMSVIGDSGDDVDGVNGVGQKRFLGFFKELLSLTGSMGDIYKKVQKKSSLFNLDGHQIQNKYLKDVVDSELKENKISNNLKLVSFELIAREFDSPNSIEMSDRKEKLLKTLNSENIMPVGAMKPALEMSGVFLEESSIDFLYIL